MRQIVLDTETTGLYARNGDRVVEIGCVELVGRKPTGRRLHRYINPEREVPIEAQRIHGLTDEFLADKPKFRDVAAELADFIRDAELVIHNASFDMEFLNVEFALLGNTDMESARQHLRRRGRYAQDGARHASGQAQLARCPVLRVRRRQLQPPVPRRARSTPNCWPRSIWP